VALAHEYRDRIDFLSFNCGLTSTKMVGNLKEDWKCISPKKAAFGVLKDIGQEDYRTNGHP
jgi:hypothetical protein